MNKLIAALLAAQILGGTWLVQHAPKIISTASQHFATYAYTEK